MMPAPDLSSSAKLEKQKNIQNNSEQYFSLMGTYSIIYIEFFSRGWVHNSAMVRMPSRPWVWICRTQVCSATRNNTEVDATEVGFIHQQQTKSAD